MPTTPIKSCNKYVLTYKDDTNIPQQVGIYAKDAFDCLTLARQLNPHVNAHPISVVRIQQKF